MDTDSWLLFGLLIVLILGGGYFAAAETAFASVNPLHIRNRAENGEKRTQRASYVLDHFNKALSTLLIGNNIMHIGTASIATYLVTKLWGEGYTGYSTILTTLVVFLVSEMIPKQFAKDRPEWTALLFASSLYWLIKILTPIAAVFDFLSGIISKFLRVKTEPTITEDELVEMIDSLANSGEDDSQRRNLLHSALTFDDVKAQDVMTPLQEVVSVSIRMKPEAVLSIIRNHKFSRIPVYLNTSDNIIGILNVRSYIKRHLSQPDMTSVRMLMTKAMHVEAAKCIDDLFHEMTQSRTHMCVVRDEQGKSIGIITMEDILEQLVGEIWDEDDVVPAAKEGQV